MWRGSRDIPMAGSFTGQYVGVFRHTKGGEFHRSLRGGGSRHIPMAGSFTGHYVAVSRHTPRDGGFTGHYVGEILDTLQWLGVSQNTMWGRL
jgi:hypothetical protein